MEEEQMDVTTADMLEIVAGGGNGVEYVDISSLIEKAAKELREKDDEIERLRSDVNRMASLAIDNARDMLRLREALKDAGQSLEWAARRLKDNYASNADVMATHLAAGKTADARAALKEGE